MLPARRRRQRPHLSTTLKEASPLPQSRISVVIPCHNEEAGIRAVIERMPRPLVDEICVGEHRVGESKLNLRRDGFGNLLQLFKMRLSLAGPPRPRTARPLAVGGAVQETCA